MKTLKTAAVAVLIGFAGVAFAQTPALTVGVTAPNIVLQGASKTIATITLSGGAQAAMLTSLPISLGYSATYLPTPSTAVPFTNCMLVNNASSSAALNTGANGMPGARGSGSFMVNFDQPLVIPAQSNVVLNLVCDINAAVPNGSAIATRIQTANIQAKDPSGSLLAAGSNSPMAITSVGTASSEDTSTTASGNTNSGTPGTPNTGAGGDAPMTWLMLAISGILAIAGATYIVRTRQA